LGADENAAQFDTYLDTHGQGSYGSSFANTNPPFTSLPYDQAWYSDHGYEIDTESGLEDLIGTDWSIDSPSVYSDSLASSSLSQPEIIDFMTERLGGTSFAQKQELVEKPPDRHVLQKIEFYKCPFCIRKYHTLEAMRSVCLQ
jgi:hypothetical protein